MSDDLMDKSLQEDVLTLLVWDDDFCSLVDGTIEPKLFGPTRYKKIAQMALDFHRSFKKAMGIHIVNELSDELNGEQRELYQNIVESICDLHDKVNREYVITRLERFIRQRTFINNCQEALDMAIAGNIDKAENIMSNGHNSRLKLFDPGIIFDKSEAVFNVLYPDTMVPDFVCGIPELDVLGISPSRGEMFSLEGLKKIGKTQCTIHISKENVARGETVVYVTLELTKEKLLRRYIQSVFAIAKSEAKFISQRISFNKNLQGFESFDINSISREDIKVFDDPDDLKVIEEKLKKYRSRGGRFVIKSFPPNSLTVDGLRAYLNNLEQIEGIKPDILIVDCPSKMKMKGKDFRIAMSQTTIGLEGLIKERNIAGIFPYHVNREGDKSNIAWNRGRNLAEDYSTSMHTDVLISLNQTESEKELGLIRLFVADCRDEIGGVKVLVANNFSIGQFCLDSVYLKDDESYTEILKDV